MNAKLSALGASVMQLFESCKLVAYLDSNGVPTIGWGHTAGVNLGDTCTQAQADAWFLEDTQVAVDAVNADVKIILPQHSMDAFYSIAYNIGITRFSNSTLLALVNEGQHVAAGYQFLVWDKPASIVARRKVERALYMDQLNITSGVSA